MPNVIDYCLSIHGKGVLYYPRRASMLRAQCDIRDTSMLPSFPCQVPRINPHWLQRIFGSIRATLTRLHCDSTTILLPPPSPRSTCISGSRMRQTCITRRAESAATSPPKQPGKITTPAPDKIIPRLPVPCHSHDPLTIITIFHDQTSRNPSHPWP